MNFQRPFKLLIPLLAAVLLLSLAPMALAAQNSVSGTLFVDENGNSRFDAGEAPLAGVDIALISVQGAEQTSAQTARTDAAGQYAFEGLADGRYALRLTLPDKLVPTPFSEGGSFLLPGKSGEAMTPVFTLSDGQAYPAVHLGAGKATAVLKVVAFGDDNQNGGRFSSEPLLKDVEVAVVFEYAGQEYTVAAGRTNKEGAGTLSGFTPGTYRVKATLPPPYIPGPVGSKINLFYNAIQPSGQAAGYSAPLAFTAQEAVGMGISGIETGSVKGRIILPNDQGAQNVSVQAIHPQLGVIRDMATDVSGAFAFDRLEAGQYSLRVTLPDTVMFDAAMQPLLSSYEQTGDVPFEISMRKETAITPIRVQNSTALVIRAFHDANANGLLDEGEKPFQGARISVKDSRIAPIDTNSKGQALLARLPQGEHTIEAELPDGHIFSVATPGGNAFSTVRGAAAAQADIQIESGRQHTMDLAVTLPAAIQGTLFQDENLSGVLDSGETGIAGFTVEALNEQGAVITSAQTDENGRYILSGLIPAPTTVRVGLVSPYIFSAPSQTGAVSENKIITQSPTHGLTAPITLAPGQTHEHADAGAFRSAVVNGSVLLGDKTLLFDGKQGGLAGVSLQLVDEQLAPISDYTVAQTGDEGSFSLKGALPGTYRLAYTLPATHAFTRPFSDEATHYSEVFTLKSSDEMTLEPIFAIALARLEGKVFVDADFDGFPGEKEVGLHKVSLSLTDEDGKSIRAISDENGRYAFEKLRPGKYQSAVTLPNNMLNYTVENAFAPAALSPSATGEMTFAPGENKQNVHQAAVFATKLTLTAFYDQDLTGTMTAGDTPYHLKSLKLFHPKTQTYVDLTDTQDGTFTADVAYPGQYQFTLSLPNDHILFAPKEQGAQDGAIVGQVFAPVHHADIPLAVVQHASIEGTVWNLDGTTNRVKDIALSLQNDESGEEVRRVHTDAEGRFLFDKLLPGVYRLTAALPQGYLPARMLDTAIRASYITVSEQGRHTPAPITLQMGEQKQAVDIGMGAPSTIGDLVWLDLNKNGLQDSGEPGIPNFTLSFTQNGTPAYTVTTNEYGRYLIENMYPGSYTLVADVPDGMASTAPQSEFPLLTNVLPQGLSGHIELENFNVLGGETNRNIDFGFILTNNQRPAFLDHLPQKDWTPLPRR